MMTPAELDAAIAAMPGEKVTRDYIKGRIVSQMFFRVGETVTMCNIALDNGYSVRGESACVDPVNFNQEIGQQLAFEDAFRKLWPLYGFLLAESRLARRGSAAA